MKLSVVAQNDNVNEADFVKTEAWYETYESSVQRQNAEVFNRVSMIKQLLFDVNQDLSKVQLLYLPYRKL